MNHTYLSLGSNTNAETNLRKAVALLRDRCDAVFGVTVSPVYESAAVGGSGTYLNAAALVETEMSAQAFKERILRDIESHLGRTRDSDVVTIDLDIVLFNNEAIDSAALQHAYVAVPLADIAPDYVHPQTGETLKTHAAKLGDGITRRENIQLD